MIAKADEISVELRNWFNPRVDFVVPNLYLGWFEADVLKINKKGIMHEYEIKTSRKDFKADGVKAMHGQNKHELLKAGKLRPNRFSFVVPAGLITKSEVPKEFGLIWYHPKPGRYTSGWTPFTIVKQPRKLHDRTEVDWFNMARLAGYKLHCANQYQISKIRTLSKLVSVLPTSDTPTY